MKVGTFATGAMLIVLVIGVAVPAASASSPDAVARFVVSHQQPADLLDRWLTVHQPTVAAEPLPVSDLESSLIVERRTVAAAPSPVSDIASSLERDRRAFASQPAPVSDIANSLDVASAAAAVEAPTAKSGTQFAWGDAGIGAGVAFVLIAFGIASLTIVRRHRQLAA